MEEDANNNDKIIKHLVISGGGHSFFTFYGILKEAHNQGFWSHVNIETIYGTSAGALIGFIMSLNIEFDILDKYFIKRPWDKVFNLNIEQIFGIFDNLGIYSQEHICEIINPLLCSKDLDVNITLLELYNHTNIELHAFATELNSFTTIDFSYKTHPTWKVIDVITASVSIPFIFKPVFIDNECYIDGCITNDFPIVEYIKHHDIDEALFIKKENKNNITLNKFCTFTNFFTIFIQRVLIKHANYDIPKNIICVKDNICTLTEITAVSSSEEIRKEMINMGVCLCTSFLENIRACNP